MKTLSPAHPVFDDIRADVEAVHNAAQHHRDTWHSNQNAGWRDEQC